MATKTPLNRILGLMHKDDHIINEEMGQSQILVTTDVSHCTLCLAFEMSTEAR